MRQINDVSLAVALITVRAWRALLGECRPDRFFLLQPALLVAHLSFSAWLFPSATVFVLLLCSVMRLWLFFLFFLFKSCHYRLGPYAPDTCMPPLLLSLLAVA